jgi:integral membrane sensor domain MASE1/GAF domain-containing protein
MTVDPVRREAAPAPLLAAAWVRPAGVFTVVAIAYTAGSEVAWQWFGASSVGSAFFPPAGVTVAALLLTRRSWWPAVIVAIALSEISVDVQHSVPVAAAAGFAAANSLEPLVGAVSVLLLCGGMPDLGLRRDLVRFIGGACVLGPLIGALVGSTVAWWWAGQWWPGAVLQWWAGDGVAVLVVASPILLWPRRREVLAARRAELALVVASTVAATAVFFLAGLPSTLVLLPLLAWAAFQLGDFGVVLVGAAYAFPANYLTAAGYGTFGRLDLPSHGVRGILQAYIAVVVLVGLVMAQEVRGRLGAVQETHAAQAARDSEEARRAAAEVGAMIADGTSVTDVAEQVVRAVRDRLGADHAVINALGDDEHTFVRLASTGLPPTVAALAGRFTAASDAPGPQAVRQQSPVYRSDRRAVRSEFADKRLVEAMAGVRAVAAMPLLTEAGAQGYLDVCWAEPHGFPAAERDYLEAVAEMASRGLERARLREAERRERQRLQTLAELARLLSAALTPADIGQIVTSHVRSDAGAHGVGVGVISDDGRHLEWITAGVVAERPEGPAASATLASTSLSIRDPATDAARTGRPVILRSAGEYQAQYPRDAGMQAAPVPASFLGWPLTVGARTCGVLALMWSEPQPLDQSQLAFASTIASVVAQGIVRARKYADEQAIASVLQQAVVPKAAAGIPGLDLGACYQPAAPGQAVGGDWYDAMELPKGLIYLAVGDVVGHGLAAAEDMTQLRNAGRALAIQGLRPGRLLAELSTLTGLVTHGKFATMSVAVLDPADSSVAYASAGHPPMLVRRAADGQVARLEGATGPALGAFDGVSYAVGSTLLGPDDVLLMYTDGLIERRGEDIDEGIGRLEQQLGGWPAPPGAPLASLCGQLTAALTEQAQYDDVCVLAIRHTQPCGSQACPDDDGPPGEDHAAQKGRREPVARAELHSPAILA